MWRKDIESHLPAYLHITGNQCVLFRALDESVCHRGLKGHRDSNDLGSIPFPVLSVISVSSVAISI
jgi:hypothetical protein